MTDQERWERVTAAIERAKGIPGWQEPDELLWLAQQAFHAQVVVEVGCYAGKTTSVLAAAVPHGGIVYAVDDWRGEADRPDLVGHVLKARFWESVGEQSPIMLLEQPSIGAAAFFGAMTLPGMQPIDLLYIDASHDYGSVRDDIAAWRPLVKPGGLMAGHDYYQEGVQRAVNEAFGSQRAECPCERIWAVRL